MENYIFLIILLFFELLLLIYSWKNLNKCAFSPSVYTLALFTISTILCIYCIEFWKIKFHLETFIAVSSGLFSIVLAEKIATTKKMSNEQIQIKQICFPNWIKITFSIYSIIATFLYFNEIRKIGLAHAMLVGDAIAVIKEDYSYYEKQFNPFIRQGYKFTIAIAYIYTYVFINNYIVCKQKIKSAFWYIIPLFSAVGINLISGSRGDMLRMVLLFLFYYYICVWQQNGWKKRPTKQILKIAIPSLLTMLTIFFFARLFVKVNVESQTKMGGPIEYFSYYIASPLQVFNIHIKQLAENPNANSQMSFAYNTMRGIYDFVENQGFIEKKSIIHPKLGSGFEYVGGDSNAAGNVDTFFSQSYIDFGLIGMCIYSFVIYFLISRYFHKYILYKNMTYSNVRRLLKFSFFYYIVDLSFYDDCVKHIICQTGVLQYICLLVLIHFLIVPQYFKPIK